jgi:putative ABC transport system permease protein
LLLVWRLVRGDIKRRWVQSLMLVVMITATTATLTLSLALQGVTDRPFAHTRAATKGPDVAGLFEPDFHGTAGTLKEFEALRHAPGVIGSSGPFPVTRLELTYGGHEVRVRAEGRNSDRATLDQPLLTAGHWTTADGVVVERSFADALGVHVGDTIHLAGRALTVRGIAVTSAMPTGDPLVWLDSSTLLRLANRSEPLWYALNLELSDPNHAQAFADAHNTPNSAWALQSWQEVRADDSVAMADERQLLVMGSVLLAIIAVAGIAVMVGGRMAEQTRRVGLLKAVGATPRLIALVLMAENLLLAAAGAIAGLVVGRLVAPALTNPGASLLGNAGIPTLDATTVGLAVALAAVVAVAATGLPALSGAAPARSGRSTTPLAHRSATSA